jgi:hypothetical protein
MNPAIVAYQLSLKKPEGKNAASLEQKKRLTNPADKSKLTTQINIDEAGSAESKLVASNSKVRELRCPECDSTNVEEHDRDIKCIDCNFHFRTYGKY